MMPLRKTKGFLMFITFVAMVFFFGCQKTTEDTDKITVAVSIPPLKSVVEAIAQDHVQIVTLIPPGSSPESYEPSPGILSSLEDSLLYFSLGVPAEEANIKPKALQLNRDLTIINLHEEAAKSYPDLTVEGERDPHVWLSIKRVKIMTDVIKERLIRIDPDHASDYRRNAEDFQKLLDETDETIRETIEKLKSKEFIIYHPALGYFADEYGLTMIAVEEHGKEASIKQLGDVVDYAKSKGIKTVFYQAEHDKKQAEIVASEIGGKTRMIDPLSSSFPQNLIDIADALLESEGSK
ncbi:MAG: zinc ABC transporter solute-binding protein [Clostridiaceae bacterium]|jgi:zinc transport system substrate-binding protein|nr:zinc ABC transporter solute-binding protein [Clostridiaceae bacterium]